MAILRAFISYRSSDTGELATELAQRLKPDLGLDAVYFAPTDNALFDDWAANIVERLADSQVVVALVGEKWTGECSHVGGHRDCILDDRDWVRREVAYALSDPDTVVLPVTVGVDRLPDPEVPDLKGLSTTQGLVMSSSNLDESGYQQILTGCWLSLKRLDDDTMIVVSDGTDEATVDLERLVAELQDADMIDASRLSATVNDPDGLRAIPLRHGCKRWPKVIVIAPRTRRDVIVARLQAIARVRGVRSVALVGVTAVATRLDIGGLAKDASVDVAEWTTEQVVASASRTGRRLLSGKTTAGLAGTAGLVIAGAAYFVTATGGNGLDGFLTVVGASEDHVIVVDADREVAAIDATGSGEIVFAPTLSGNSAYVVYEPAADLAAYFTLSEESTLDVVVWSPADDEQARVVDVGNSSGTRGLALTADGTTLAISDVGRIGIWSIEDGSARLRDEVITDSVWPYAELSFSPDGSRLAFTWESSSGGTKLEVINLDDGQRRTVREGEAYGVTWSPDGNMLAFDAGIGGNLGSVVVADLDEQSNAEFEVSLQTHLARQGWSKDSEQLLLEGNTASESYFCFLTVTDGTYECPAVEPGPWLSQFTWLPSGDVIAYYAQCGFPRCDSSNEGLWRISPAGAGVAHLLEHTED